MSLHPVLRERLNVAQTEPSPSGLTRRDARLSPLANKAHAVIGMRRSGKSTYLRQVQADRRAASPDAHALYVSFDDDRLADIGVEQLDFLLEEVFRRAPDRRGRPGVTLLLDEIQLVPEWERFIRRVLDTEAVEFVLSGSSARMLSREIHTSLRGRGAATVIRPFSFREYLRHRGEEPEVEPGRWLPAERSRVEARFRDYLIEGGFPEAQGLAGPVRVELLQGYVDVVLFRDVVERYRVTQVAALRWLVRNALRNAAGLLSVHRLHRDLRAQGLAIAKDALYALLDHLLDAFLLSVVPIASASERRMNVNPRKVYPADPGLIGAFEVSGRANVGHALETAVCNELERRGCVVRYVRTVGGYEVDFLARYPDGTSELLQVCATLADPTTLHREVRALREAGAEFPEATPRLLVLDRDDRAVALAAGVAAEPAYEWLLDGSRMP